MTNGWRLDITPAARRELRRLDPPIRQRILAALDQLAADPLAANLVKVTGRPESRLRAGAYWSDSTTTTSSSSCSISAPADAPTETER